MNEKFWTESKKNPKKPINQSIDQINMNDTWLEKVDNFKYIGVTLTKGSHSTTVISPFGPNMFQNS